MEMSFPVSQGASNPSEPHFLTCKMGIVRAPPSQVMSGIKEKGGNSTYPGNGTEEGPVHGGGHQPSHCGRLWGVHLSPL